MYYLEFKLNKEVKVCGEKLLNIFYNLFNIIYWISIFFLVWCHSGHISKIDKYKSSSLKIKQSVFTNFTENEFRPYLYRPNFLSEYNRVWDSDDYSFSQPDEIQVITNLVITPNQTRSTCPESPYVDKRGFLCDPDNNHCEKGRHTVHGISTGKCVPCDIRFSENSSDIWTDRHCCQIEGGWCPVQYYLFPLKNHTAVLKNSKNSTLWLRNIVTFNEYDIILDNQIDPNLTTYLECRYDPQTDPKCTIFKLEKILELSKNNRQDYDTMANFGGLVNVNISYKCFLPFWYQVFSLSLVPNMPFFNVPHFDQRRDCEWGYDFYRVDSGDRPLPSGNPTFTQTFLYDYGNTRTHWQTYRLRITVDVKASIGYYNPFKFFAIFFAYHGLYSLLKMIISIIVRKMLAKNKDKDKIEDEIIFNANVPEQQQPRAQNENYEINEMTPLVLKSTINLNGGQTSLSSRRAQESTL